MGFRKIIRKLMMLSPGYRKAFFVEQKLEQKSAELLAAIEAARPADRTGELLAAIEAQTDRMLLQYLSAFLVKSNRRPAGCRRDFSADRFVRFTYRKIEKYGRNVGDWFQTFAVENALSSILEEDSRGAPTYVDCPREELLFYTGDPAICIMQGWFEHGVMDFMPNGNILPVWVGFHLTPYMRPFFSTYRKFLPFEVMDMDIGCRDLSTLQFFNDLHVPAYFSRCLSLTFPKRSVKDSEGADTIFLVNCPSWVVERLPKHIREDGVAVIQAGVDFKTSSIDAMRQRATEFLERYRKQAKLVVTTLLHCAAPCCAMGIPVVFIDAEQNPDPQHFRYSTLNGILPIYTRDNLGNGSIDFKPLPVDIEPLKRDLLTNLKLSIARARGESVLDSDLFAVRKRIAEFNAIQIDLQEGDGENVDY